MTEKKWPAHISWIFFADQKLIACALQNVCRKSVLKSEISTSNCYKYFFYNYNINHAYNAGILSAKVNGDLKNWDKTMNAIIIPIGHFTVVR